MIDRPLPVDELVPAAPLVMDRRAGLPAGWFEARVIDPPNALVWFSERGRDLRFSWALVLVPVGTAASELLIRLRISRHIGQRAPALSQRAGELFDLVTVRLMIAGLRERLRES